MSESKTRFKPFLPILAPVCHLDPVVGSAHEWAQIAMIMISDSAYFTAAPTGIGKSRKCFNKCNYSATWHASCS